MHPYHEIRDRGEPGESFLGLARKLLAQTARARDMPPPSGFQTWSADAIEESLCQVFAKKPGLIMALYVQATDERSFERLILKAFDSALIDIARGTPQGKMVRRLRTVLGGSDMFQHLIPPANQYGWTLAGRSTTRSGAARSDLLRSAYTVSGEIPRLNRAGPTPRPIRDLLCAVSSAVLTSASGAVSESDLATVIVERFNLHESPSDSLDEFDTLTESEIAEVCWEVWELMSHHERLFMPFLDPSAPIPDSISTRIGPHEQGAIRRTITSKVIDVGLTDDASIAVVAALVSLARARSNPVASSDVQERSSQSPTIPHMPSERGCDE